MKYLSSDSPIYYNYKDINSSDYQPFLNSISPISQLSYEIKSNGNLYDTYYPENNEIPRKKREIELNKKYNNYKFLDIDSNLPYHH